MIHLSPSFLPLFPQFLPLSPQFLPPLQIAPGPLPPPSVAAPMVTRSRSGFEYIFNPQGVNEVPPVPVSGYKWFLPRDALVHSAVMRLLSSVRLSVCLSVTFRYRDDIGWKSWKLIARSISPTPSLFVAQRPSTYSHGNMGKFGGD